MFFVTFKNFFARTTRVPFATTGNVFCDFAKNFFIRIKSVVAKLMLANFKLRTTSNAAAEKTEATRTDVYNAKTPGFKANNTTVANGELRTVGYNTEAPGVKAKEATDK
ncbi:hypothetical protein IW136_004623 [Coemansia sp. RSA 678]|nr:hypothetical protein IW136_004623 [Coemansia sp. RSA 678]